MGKWKNVINCYICGRKCGNNNGWTKEAEMVEYHKNFPNDPLTKESLVRICDDCYKKLDLED